MRGFVDEIIEGKTKKDGKLFQIYVIGSEKLYQWNTEYFDRVKEGDILDFDVKQSGDFKNIEVKRVFKVVGEEDYKRMKQLVTEKEHVIRMSALKTSANLISDLKATPYEKGSLAIDMSDQFVRYIRGEEIDEDFFAPREFKSELNGE